MSSSDAGRGGQEGTDPEPAGGRAAISETAARPMARTVADAVGRAPAVGDTLEREAALANVLSRVLTAKSEAPRVGRYSILMPLGEGGMGTVYAAFDDKLERRVALKLIKDTQSDVARSRMLREAQAMASLAHPNVVPIFEVGEHDGKLFIVMEHVKGVTLGDWCEADSRTWREVLEKYLQAGEGLAAAHAAGLVHRDFKPANAVVGAEGRVRVLDFGLAARDADVEVDMDTTDSGGVPSLDQRLMNSPLTQTGVVMGTPAYMPPEQAAGGDVDARSDQFSYCVALWEALYGSRPFAGATAAEVAGNARQGEITEPAPHDVPAAVRPVLERGLDVDPGKRFDDMATLLAQLETITVDAGPRRRAGRFIVGALVAGTAVVFGARWVDARQREAKVAACESTGNDEIAAVYDEGTRERIQAGLLATGLGHAATTAETALPRLDDYAEAWRGARTEVCLASEVERTLGAEDRGRSLWCLEQRAMELAALVEQLESADRSVVNRATAAAAGLSRVQECRDEDLLPRLPEPPDPEGRASERELRVALYEAEALIATSQYDDAVELARAAVKQAQSLDRPELVAAAGRSLGYALEHTGDFEEAEKVLVDAYFTAAEAHDFETAIEVCNSLVYVVGYRLSRHDDGLVWSRLGDVAMSELGVAEGDLRWARPLAVRAMVHSTAGQTELAQEAFARSLQINEDNLGPEHPEVARSVYSLGTAKLVVGDREGAKPLLERALGIQERTLGPDHPVVASTLNNLGNLSRSQQDLEVTKSLYERALAIQERALGLDHPTVANTIVNLGDPARR